jgi:alcohol dehydrogenase (nicotinoprotein)
VVIFGAGGVGTNAVQGAQYAGARHIVVVDPVEFKRENAMEFGAANGGIVGYQRRIQGHLFGMCNPLYDIPRLLGLYRDGQLKLDELITRRYRLDEINQGYQDLAGGKLIRGVIIHGT